MTKDWGSSLANAELVISDVSAGYGRKLVLQHVSLTLHPGELLAVIGLNGAGKSTLLKAIMGYADISDGIIEFRDCNITARPAHERVRLGLSYLMQGAEIFPSLSVRENLLVAAACMPFKSRAPAITAVLDTWPQINGQLDTRAGLLSGGQRQAVAIAMLLVSRPAVLLLDEPSAGLAPSASDRLLKQIQDLNRGAGVTVIVVEQKVREVLEIATRSIILNNGSVYAETSKPREWLNLERLEHYVFGRPALG